MNFQVREAGSPKLGEQEEGKMKIGEAWRCTWYREGQEGVVPAEKAADEEPQAWECDSGNRDV